MGDEDCQRPGDVLLIGNARSAPEENIESNEMKIYAIAVIEMMAARTHDTTSRAPMFAEDTPKSDDTAVRYDANCARQSFSSARTIPRRTIRRRGLDDGVAVVHVAENLDIPLARA